MAQILLRRDTAANWQTADPVLGSGEIGIETDTGKAKLGDGTTSWNSLPYFKDRVFTDGDYTDLQTVLSSSHSHTNKAILDIITNSGDGTQYLANDGTYKAVTGSGATTFDALTDTPDTKIAGKYLKVDDTGAVITYADGTAPVNITGAVTVPNIKELRAFTGMADGDMVYVQEYGRGNGKGGGWFVYRASMDQSAHDGGWYFKSDSGTGVWERWGMKRGFYCAYDFGAVGSSDNFTSYNAAVNPLSLYYATLAEAQEDYPFADSLDLETDWCAWRQLNASEEWYHIGLGKDYVAASLVMYDSTGTFYFNRELWVRAIYVYWSLPGTTFNWINTNSIKGTLDVPKYVLRFENRFLAVDPNNPNANHAIPYPDNWEGSATGGWYGSSAGTSHRYSYWGHFGVFQVNEVTPATGAAEYVSGMMVQGFEGNCEFYKIRVEADWDGFIARGANMLSTFQNCRFSGSRDAFAQLHLTGNIATTVYLRDCEFYNFGRYGCYLYTIGTFTSFTVQNCDIEGRITGDYFGGIFTNDNSWFYQGVKAAFFCQGGDLLAEHLRFEDIGDGSNDYSVHVEGKQCFFNHCYMGSFNGSIFTAHVTGADGTLHTPDWESHLSTYGWVDITDTRNAYVYAGPDNVVDAHPGKIRFENTQDMGHVHFMNGMDLNTITLYSVTDTFVTKVNQTLPATETSGLPPKSDFVKTEFNFSDPILDLAPFNNLAGGRFISPSTLVAEDFSEGVSISGGAFSKYKTTVKNIDQFTVCGEPFIKQTLLYVPNGANTFLFPARSNATVLNSLRSFRYVRMNTDGSVKDYLELPPFRKAVIREDDSWQLPPKYTEDGDRRAPFIEGDIFYKRDINSGTTIGVVCVAEGTYAQTWAEGLDITAGEGVRPIVWNGHYYTSQADGMTCDVQPTFPTSAGGTVTETPGYAVWASGTYGTGAKVMPSTANGFFYECTTAGDTGTTEPTWPTTNGATVTDGAVVWTARAIVTWVEAGANVRWEWFGKTYGSDRFSGTTANRPVDVEAGFQYFDTDLSKPIWWSGSQWVDATGTAV